MRNAIIIAALCGLLAACGSDNNPPSSGGGSGYVPPVDQPIQQDGRTFASLEVPAEQVVPATVDTCGHRECGQVGYGMGLNMRTGQLGFGFGTGAINF